MEIQRNEGNIHFPCPPCIELLQPRNFPMLLCVFNTCEGVYDILLHFKTCLLVVREMRLLFASASDGTDDLNL